MRRIGQVLARQRRVSGGATMNAFSFASNGWLRVGHHTRGDFNDGDEPKSRVTRDDDDPLVAQSRRDI
jgi:hypothetical protein